MTDQLWLLFTQEIFLFGQHTHSYLPEYLCLYQQNEYKSILMFPVTLWAKPHIQFLTEKRPDSSKALCMGTRSPLGGSLGPFSQAAVTQMLGQEHFRGILWVFLELSNQSKSQLNLAFGFLGQHMNHEFEDWIHLSLGDKSI